MPFSVGQTIGPYRVMEQLGQGGMATVYKAYHASLDRYIAVKVLHQAFLEDPTFLARFQREARLVARLEHPNIVPIYDYAEHEGQPYLIMKYIEGETLKARLQSGPLSGGEVSHIAETVGAGLAYAHKQGILHRDIKPSNVILSKEGGTYLADFGLARIAQAGDSTLTSDMILGTPQYISPEQALGKPDLNEGTDIYSFGVMLYEITTGRVPFSADTPFSIIHDHIYSPLPLPSIVNPKVSPDLERVLLKALAKEREDRYPNVPALIEAFQQAWADSAPTQANLSMAPAPQAAPSPKPDSAVSAARTAPAILATPQPAAAVTIEPGPQKKSRRIQWLWIALAVLAGLACIIVFSATRDLNLRADLTFGSTSAAPGLPSLPSLEVPPVQPVQPIPGQIEEEIEDEAIPLETRSLADAEKRYQDDPDAPINQIEYGLALLEAGKEDPAYKIFLAASESIARQEPRLLLGFGAALKKREIWPGALLMYLRFAEQKQTLTPFLLNNLRESAYFAYANPAVLELVDFGLIGRFDLPTSLMAQARYVLLHRDDPAQVRDLLSELRQTVENMPEAGLIEAELLLRQGKSTEARAVLKSILAGPLPSWVEKQAKQMLETIP
jgi:serine/threonine protein kinase